MNGDQTLRSWQASLGSEALTQVPNAVSAQPPIETSRPAEHPAGRGAMRWMNKTVLLVDSNLQSRQSRSKILRALGVRVDCAANAASARARLAQEKYNLILVDLGQDISAAESLVEEIRTRNARQLVGFLVGRPLFVATSLRGKRARLQPALAPAPEVPALRPNRSGVTTSDFGRKIRAAEAAAAEADRIANR